MSEKRFSMPPLIGASSLLTIFAVLCLTVFALLSISTVNAHQRLRESASQAVTGYYRADCMAEEILAHLRSGECPNGVTECDGIFSYACAVSDTQALVVEVAVNGEDYTVLRWQAVSTADWEADDRILVWSGE